MNSSATASGNSTIVGWVSSDSDRSTLDILYSSGITIILCVWVSTYPNVPAPTDRWYHHLIDKANLAMIGALGPDLLFGLALGQYSSARRSVETFTKKWPQHPWTITHAFYADMGGFRVGSDQDDFDFPINAEQLFYLIDHRHIEFPTISERDLRAMSSRDIFSKAIVIWQVFCFIVTTTIRFAHGLPVTTLEVTAFVFAVMMIATSLAWFQKPQITVSTPVYLAAGVSFEDVRQCARATTHPDLKDWHETPLDFIWKRGRFRGDKHWQHLSHLSHKARFPLFTRLPGHPWVRMPSDIWIRPQGSLTIFGVLLQIPFCLSLLWPWNFHFATETERILWRASAIYHAIYTCFITLYYLLWLDESRVARLSKVCMTKLGILSSSIPPPPPPSTPVKDEIAYHELPAPNTSEEESNSTGSSAWCSLKAKTKKLGQTWTNLSPSQDPEQNVSRRFSTPIFIFTVIYIFSHLYVYVEDIIALRSQPADVYQATKQFFPLIR